MRFTADQLTAIRAEGSVAITAGAGTGKTAMLASRFVHHVVEHGLSPLQIVAATFTEKAASELRARIREEMMKVGDERHTAEVDAAQIGTIHALAGRICRDFSHLSGLPPDFSLMDESESIIRTSSWFSDAVALIDPATIREFGYSWIKESLGVLLRDPFLTDAAFNVDPSIWQAEIEKVKKEALAELRDCDEVSAARRVLPLYSGPAGDKLDEHRRRVIDLIAKIESGGDLVELRSPFAGFRSNLGSAKIWDPEALAEVRSAIVGIRSKCNEVQKMIDLTFGEGETLIIEKLSMLRQAYETVRDQIAVYKRNEKAYDFVDLEYFALKTLEFPDVQKHYGERWKAILVDEFQDTNPVQEILIRRLMKDVRLTIVGDEKQSIYGFRRADVDVFRRFRAEIPETVMLSRTFRTHAGLVDPMNRMFEKLLGRSHQPLDAERLGPPSNAPAISATIITSKAKSEVDSLRLAEADLIANKIRQMIDEKTPVLDKRLGETRPIRPGDIAVLSRTRSSLELYADALQLTGLPVVNNGRANLLETRTAKDILAILRFALDPTDDISLIAILRGPCFAISDKVLFELAKRGTKDLAWWAMIQEAQTTYPLVSDAASVLFTLKELGKTMAPIAILEEFDRIVGYTAVIANLPQGARRLADWFGFLEVLRDIGKTGRSDLLGTIRYLDVLRDFSADIPRPMMAGEDAVNLMTIHGSKGLEWPVVFVSDLGRKPGSSFERILVDDELGIAFKVEVESDGEREGVTEHSELTPSIVELMRSRIAEKEKAEAKRILYVAMTRARDYLHLTSAGDKGQLLELLEPCLRSAGIEPEMVEAESIEPVSLDQWNLGERTREPILQIDPIPVRISALPVTGLTDLSICPKRFRFMHIDGHPGLGTGSSDARTIGTLVHLALEFGFTDVSELRPVSAGASDTLLAEAFEVAGRFKIAQAFANFSEVQAEREVPLSVPFSGIELNGTADLVGDDFVLDFKTDQIPDPAHHRFQLWAYAYALGKPKAYIAYLRHDLLHEFGPADLQNAGEEAMAMIELINAGHYEAKPDPTKCSYCPFSVICEESAA